MVAFSLVLWVGWWVGLVVEGCDDEEDAGVFFVESAVVEVGSVEVFVVIVWEEPSCHVGVNECFGGWVEVGGVVAASPALVDPDVDLGVGEGGDLVVGVLLFPLVDVVVGCVFPLVGVFAVGVPVGAVTAVDGEEGFSFEGYPAEDWFAVGGLFEGHCGGWGVRRVECHWWCPFGVGWLVGCSRGR